MDLEKVGQNAKCASAGQSLHGGNATGVDVRVIEAEEDAASALGELGQAIDG